MSTSCLDHVVIRLAIQESLTPRSSGTQLGGGVTVPFMALSASVALSRRRPSITPLSIDGEAADFDHAKKPLDQVSGPLVLGSGECHGQHRAGERADQESPGSASPGQPPRQSSTLDYSGYPSSSSSEPIPSC